HQGESATDAEKRGAYLAAAGVCDRMKAAGWPEPGVLDSGNGYGLYWRCDLPNDAESRKAHRAFLLALKADFPGIGAEVYNANRLTKLPGTWARKGEPSAERPHRPCRFLVEPSGFGR